MKYSKFLIVSMAVLLAGGMAWAQATSEPDAPYVFATEGFTILKIEGGAEYPIYSNDQYTFFDVVYGSDEMLYAFGEHECYEPGEENGFYGGVIGFIDLDDEDPEFEVIHDACSDGPPLLAVSGSFTHTGDLVVPDAYVPEIPRDDFTGNAVWVFPENLEDYPGCTEAPCELIAPDGFVGAGVTQAANGDLILADTGNQAVWGVEYETDAGFNTEAVAQLIGDEVPLDNPVIGVARGSSGEIAVATGGTVEIYGNVEPVVGPPVEWIGDKPWYLQCDVDFPDDGDCEYLPLFIKTTASDWFYVTTQDYCYGGSEDNGYGGSLWAIDENCNIYGDEPLFTQYGMLYGVALPPTWTPPTDAYDPEPENDVEEWFISYNDHVYELTLPDECDLYVNTDLDFVFAQEVPLSCLNNLIADYVDDPDFPAEFEAFPVTYLGEETFGIVYNLEGDCDGGNGEAAGEIIHAISAYTDTVNNPRIIRCFDDTENPDLVSNGVLMDICYPEQYFFNYTCEVLELDSFFPGEGVLPDDGRIGSRGAASFSQYFVVQSGPNGYEPQTNPAAAGESCGFYWPYRGLTEPPPATECFGCGDPPVFGPFAWAAFRAKEDGGHCWWGPFITDTNFLASVARVRDEAGTPVFEQMELNTIISSPDNSSWFLQPWRSWKPYRISFWTYDWPEGIYQITAMDLEGGVPVFYDYFEIRHWCDTPGEKGCN